MTDPIRWVRSNSDADPVLRSVLRYAQSVEPDRAELAAALDAARARVRAEQAPPAALRLPRLTRGPWFRAGLVAAATSIVWAAVIALGTPATPPAALVIRAEPPAPRPTATPAPVAIDPSQLPLEPAPTASGRVRPGPATSASNASRGDEVSLLAQARRKVGDQPKEALTLTARHAAEFPNSALAEERAALEIEASFRLGQQARALDRLKRFEARYPRSAYRRRLELLRSGASSSD